MADAPDVVIEGVVEPEEEEKTQFTKLREKIESCATLSCLKELWDEISVMKKNGIVSHPEYTSLATYKAEQKTKIEDAEKKAAA